MIAVVVGLVGAAILGGAIQAQSVAGGMLGAALIIVAVMLTMDRVLPR